MNRLSIAVLIGDGIGPEVMEQALRVLRRAAELSGQVDVALDILPAGLAAYESHGATYPDETRLAVDRSDGCFLGPLTTHLYTRPGMVNISQHLRKTKSLYANIRPVRTRPNVPAVHKDVDLVVVRENTEGFYADRNVLDGNGEMRVDEDTVVSVRVVTRRASLNVAGHAFRLAEHRGRQRLVTAGHKANVLRRGCGLFLDACRATQKSYPGVELREMHVDALGMELVMRPQALDVIVSTNLFGDILSDVAAGVVGGLGLAPGLNVGPSYVVAQAVHGSAPNIAGRGIANPCAEILTAGLLLDYLGESRGIPAACALAQAMERAVDRALAEGSALTPDLGGNGTTADLGDAVLRALDRG
jgi:3-isopropylmalate dehydrogenase